VAYQYRGKVRDVVPITAAKCGTNSGYTRHRQLNTPKCQPCKDAHATYERARRRKPVMRNQCATYPGYMRHKRAGEAACDLCRAAYARYMADYRAQKKAA
jgi:hypothetical protein